MTGRFEPDTSAPASAAADILWIAACPNGLHPGFLEWSTIESDRALDDAGVPNGNRIAGFVDAG